MPFSIFFKSNIAILFYLYCIGNIFFLLNFEGIYWDDWTLYNVDTASMLSQFQMNGGFITGYIHYVLLNIANGVFMYRLLVFITFFLSGIFIYKILSQHITTQKNAFWITLIYLTIPINSAKIAIINAPSTFNLFIFFTAFFLLTKYITTPKSILYRILILFLFFISFTINSLLVFYAIIPLYMIYTIIIETKIKKNQYMFIYSVKKFVSTYIDFIVLPIIFYIVKTTYMMPSGLYETYNQINFNLDKIVNIINTSFTTSIYEPIYLSVQTSLMYWYVFLFVFITLLLIIQNKIMSKEPFYHYIIFIVLGVLVYILAVFPYATVHKLPQLNVWESRHQLLMPLGLAFILYAILSFFSKLHKNISHLFFLLLITIFTIQNIYHDYRYIKDWYYQVALEENFKSLKIIQDNTTFIAEVKLNKSLANGRNLPFYEQNGRMKKVFGDDKRLMVEQKKDINNFKKYKYYRQYNFSSWEPESPYYIIISKNHLLTNQSLYLFKMLYYQITDQKIFRSMAKNLIIIEENKHV